MGFIIFLMLIPGILGVGCIFVGMLGVAKEGVQKNRKGLILTCMGVSALVVAFAYLAYLLIYGLLSE